MQKIHTEPVSDHRQWAIYDIAGQIYIAPCYRTKLGWTFKPMTLMLVKDSYDTVGRARWLVRQYAERDRERAQTAS